MKKIVYLIIIILLLPLVIAEDIDRDGIPDEYESSHGLKIGVDDSASDTDRDGLPNINESILGTDANDPDSDGDGYLDGNEFFRGKDPLNEKNHPTNPIKVFFVTVLIFVSLAGIAFFSSYYYYKTNVKEVDIKKYAFILYVNTLKYGTIYYQRMYPHETKEQKIVRQRREELEKKRLLKREEMLRREVQRQKHDMYQKKVERRIKTKEKVFDQFGK